MPSFTWNLDPELVRIGPIAIRYYGLLFVAVFIGGYQLLRWQIERAGGRRIDADEFVAYGMVGVLGGARLGHVLFYDLDKAIADPIWVLQIWKGGLASHGATIGLVLAMALYCRRRSIPFIEGSDRFAFSAALGATLVRVGNFLNSEVVGRVTDQSWGVRFPRYDRVPAPPLRHPSQIYETVLGCAVIGILYLVDKRLGEEKRPRGALIATFFATYFTGRFIVEFFKDYQTLDPATSPLTMGQYLSIPLALVGYIGLYVSIKKHVPARWPKTESARLMEAAESTDEDDRAESRRKRPKRSRHAEPADEGARVRSRKPRARRPSSGTPSPATETPKARKPSSESR
jgi:phosphatidylglycerol---prolipoprotein diacylglyceryl transferase